MDKILKLIASELAMADLAAKAKVWPLAMSHYYAAGQMLNIIWQQQTSGLITVSQSHETALGAMSGQVTQGLQKVGRLGGNGQHNPGGGISGQADSLLERLQKCFPR